MNKPLTSAVHTHRHRRTQTDRYWYEHAPEGAVFHFELIHTGVGEDGVSGKATSTG